MTSDVSLQTALNQQQKTQAASTGLAEDFSEFLNLLTVQLQNQDPLSPMDTNEFTNQLVAFTGVEQQINTNQKLDSLVSLELGSNYNSSLSYVGKEISYVSSELNYTGTPSQIRYTLANNAALSKINVYNESGQVVYTTNAATTAGVHEFTWNGETNTGGQAPAGTYSISVDALDIEDQPISSQTMVSGRVSGVESQAGQVFLIVGERAVAVSNVLKASENNSLLQNNDALTSALSYVGLDVRYQNNQIDHEDESPNHNIVYTLEREAERGKLIVRDENGNTVYTGDADVDSGQNITSWNGRYSDGTAAPAGTYTFTIEAIDENDIKVPTYTYDNGTVTGVESDNGQIALNIGTRTVSLSNVVSVNVNNGEDA